MVGQWDQRGKEKEFLRSKELKYGIDEEEWEELEKPTKIDDIPKSMVDIQQLRV